MATASSGAFETSVYNAAGSLYPDRIRVEWSSSQSVANNTSTIYWTVMSAGGTGSSSRYVMTGPVTVSIAGVTVYSRADRFAMHVGEPLGSGSFTLTHNSDGTQSFSAWAEAAIYTYAISSTRYDYYVDLPQIPRASSISVSGTTIGSPITISISKAGSSFTHTLEYKFGNKSGTIAIKTSSSSVSWTPSRELARQIPNSWYGTGTLKCLTYNGGTLIGEKTINFILYVPNSMKPSINNFAPSIDRTNPSGCGMYVKNNSAVTWTVDAVGSYGSTITKCVINGQNLSETKTGSATSYSMTSHTLTVAGKQTYTVTVTDSRGRTASTTGEITIIDYNPPTITSITSFRSNADGSMNGSGQYVTHQLNASFYTLGGNNNIKIKAYSKKRSDATYSELNSVVVKDDASDRTSYTYTYKMLLSL